jgi:hypothetical protein
MPEYQLYFSSTPLPEGHRYSHRRDLRAHAGSGGVLVGIHQRHCHANSVERLPTPQHLAGQAVTVRLAPPFGDPMRITGVYAPAVSAAARQPLFTHLKHMVKPGAAPKDDATHIVMGDWNATDGELSGLCGSTGLANLDPTHTPKYTHLCC